MISVVIPVLNGCTTIQAQLDALAAQRGIEADFEVIVSDNGSVDDTRDIVARYPAPFRIQVVDSSGRAGVSHARNQGVLHAQGNPILICDADDEVDEYWVGAMAAAHRDGAKLMGGVLDYRRLSTPDAVAWRRYDHTGVMMHRGFLPFAHGACCGFDREVIDAVGGFDEDLLRGGDDIDFFWRAELAGYQLIFVENAVVHYRLRNHLGDMTRQAFHYGAADPGLYRRFRTRGMQRRSARAVAKTVAWLVLRSYRLLGGSAQRGAWLWSAAHQAGRVIGSVRARVVYL